MPVFERGVRNYSGEVDNLKISAILGSYAERSLIAITQPAEGDCGCSKCFSAVKFLEVI